MSVTSIHLLYKEKFEPIVRPHENVAIQTVSDTLQWGKVVYVEPIAKGLPTTISLGSLSAADASNWPTLQGSRDLTEMEVGEWELGQFRIEVLDDFLAEIRQPAAVPKFTVRTVISKIGPITKDNFAEVFVFEDDYPTVYYYSVIFDSIDNARLRFWGYRYKLEPLSKSEIEALLEAERQGIVKYTVIPATAYVSQPGR